MLKTEVYFSNRRWRFSVIEVGSLGQAIERLYTRRCENRRDATTQAAQALQHERNKRNAT